MPRKWLVPALSMAMVALPLVVHAESPGAGGKPSVVSFDWGSTDTLVALGLEEYLVGLPHQSAPDYVAHLLEGRPDVGSLKEPDTESLAAIAPDLILVTGRQGEAGQALDEVAEVMDVSLTGGDFIEAFGDKVRHLAERYDAVMQAEAALDELDAYIDRARESLPEGASVMVVTHNDGNYSLRHEPVVFELLQLDTPAVPEGVESVARGSRTFTPMTPGTMARMNPDVVLVVDRSAAIGQEALDVGVLRDALAAEGAESISVVVLNPGLWYLSGGGLNSVHAQVDEVVTALEKR
ncbi:ABC transporter substrate-binding protein [Halomonas sp. MCCC 1A11036]|uniref:ABC transporter substrate-binding protein n=1 Tax=Billgrantia zhangzhouensis TaxID=2733481 RepID=A0ABS9AJI3_9GAMM|nr:ABC transporter substrate-binding protein [Halomonas zhangzhouensis]MCE8021894.1 ABC transporter substrate-binding protein [Halomonas zhangzhouensis]